MRDALGNELYIGDEVLYGTTEDPERLVITDFYKSGHLELDHIDSIKGGAMLMPFSVVKAYKE